MSEQNSVISGRYALVDAIKQLPFTRLILASRPFDSFDGNAVTFCHALHGLGKCQVIVLHQELKDTAPGLTTKTMKNPFLLADGERWGLFPMKGA